MTWWGARWEWECLSEFLSLSRLVEVIEPGLVRIDLPCLYFMAVICPCAVVGRVF